MKMIHILFTFLTFISCKPEDIAPPCSKPDCSDTISKPLGLELIWQIPLKEDNEYTPYNRVTILDEHISFQYGYTENEKVLFVSKSDTSIYRFSDGIRGNVKQKFYHPEAGLILIDYQSVFVGKNPSAMRKIASAPSCTQFRAENNLIGDFLYLGSVRNDCKRETYVIKINVLTTETSYDRIQKDSDFPGVIVNDIEAPCLFITNQKDSLFMYCVYINIDKTPYVTNEIFHKQRNELIWIDSSFLDLNRNESYLNYFGKIICSGKKFTMLDPLTGEKFWERRHIDTRPWKGWVSGNLNLIDDKVCFLEQGHYVEIDPNTGNIIYDSPNIYSAQTASETTYFEGVLYFTAAQGGYSWIYGFRVNDRKVVLKMRSPNQGKHPFYNDTNYDINGLHIDPATRLAYTADGFFAQCFRIPESYD